MEWQGEINKGPTTGNGVGASSLEIRTGNFSKSVTLWTCIWAQTECSAGCDLWSCFFFCVCVLLFFCVFFSKCFEQSTSWCFGSHFFVARSHRFIAICHCRFIASFFFFFLRKSIERKLLCQLFTATNCSTLARHALKLICQTTFDSILFKSLRSHAGQLSCCDVTEVTWSKRGIFSCRRRRCSKRRVCFHSNQYFYVPQENVNLSNEQRVC